MKWKTIKTSRNFNLEPFGTQVNTRVPNKFAKVSIGTLVTNYTKLDFQEIFLIFELKCISYGSTARGKGLKALSIIKNTSQLIREFGTSGKFSSDTKFYWIFIWNLNFLKETLRILAKNLFFFFFFFFFKSWGIKK